jgi:hypothetical protein
MKLKDKLTKLKVKMGNKGQKSEQNYTEVKESKSQSRKKEDTN